MKKEKSQKNKNNKNEKKYNWEYHEKLNQKYESYLIENMDKNNLRLKGNYHYDNKPLNYYLSNKKQEPINNKNLTPIPQSKYLNSKTKEKNKEDFKKFSNIQKSVVEMRRIEYNIKIDQKKKKEEIKKESKKENGKEIKGNIILDRRSSMRKMRKSCIQLGNTMKLFDKKRKTMNRNEIIEYIFKNISIISKLEEDGELPYEVKIYLGKLKPRLIKIQRNYKRHFRNLKSIIRIQVNFRAHLYSRLYKEFSNRKEKITNFIYIIQKVMLLNLYHLKVNPNPKYSSKKHFVSKNIYNNDYLNKLTLLQNEVRIFLSHKNLKRIYGKNRCVYIKPYTIIPLGKIRLLQRNIILFLERLKRRHILPKSQFFVKKKMHTKKIVLIQRFARAIHQEIVRPLIPKDIFNKNNIFVKGNRKYAKKKVNFIETTIIPFHSKTTNIRVKNRESKITKSHKYLDKLVFLQRNVREYLLRDDYDIYDYPKCEEYITKESYVLPNKDKILLLQRQIKYFIYRQKIGVQKMKKVVIRPLKITKTIRTNTEKIFMRLSKLRIMYDKNLILFIVKLIENIRRYLGRISFDLIMKESERTKYFSVKGGKFKKGFAKSNFVKNVVLKVIEPEYKFVPLKPEARKFFSNKNNSILKSLKFGRKISLDMNVKSETKRSDKSDPLVNQEIEEKKEEIEEDNK